MSWRERLRTLRRETLGMNRRNLELLQGYNQPQLFGIVDHKQRTKAALLAHGLPVPTTYTTCESPSSLYAFADVVERHADFVLKPARGAGGEGVLVITGRAGDHYRAANGKILRRPHLLAHAADIVAGAYALSQTRDEALAEYRLTASPELGHVSPGGVPDVRIIVLRGVPIAGMLRLPTRTSAGRANLHSGGIGVGIDVGSGKTIHAIQNNKPIDVHPDTSAPLVGWMVPDWPQMLQLAALAYEAIPLGYFGIDIVLDVALGPVILEMNGRPGLGIQLAIERGLRPLVDAVVARSDVGDLSAAERVALGQDLSRAA